MMPAHLLPASVFFLAFVLFTAPGQGAAQAELPGEEVILLPGGGYTTMTELVNRTADTARALEKSRRDEGKGSSRKRSPRPERPTATRMTSLDP